MKQSDIVPGREYRDRDGAVRRVESIENGVVKYALLDAMFNPVFRNVAKLQTFAFMSKAEVAKNADYPA